MLGLVGGHKKAAGIAGGNIADEQMADYRL
jgi:hypothetical protein